MTHRSTLKFACLALVLGLGATIPHRALAQGSNDPLANVPKLRQALTADGFDVRQGQFRILDPVSMACTGPTPGSAPVIPSTWYNNVQPYLSIILPGYFWDAVPWEIAK